MTELVIEFGAPQAVWPHGGASGVDRPVERGQTFAFLAERRRQYPTIRMLLGLAGRNGVRFACSDWTRPRASDPPHTAARRFCRGPGDVG